MLLTADGTGKVVDFGIARHLEGRRPAVTTAGSVIGTPAYKAPGQAGGDRTIGAPAVWRRHTPVPECQATLSVEVARTYARQGRLADGYQARRLHNIRGCEVDRWLCSACYNQSRFLKMTYRLTQTTAISRIAKG